MPGEAVTRDQIVSAVTAAALARRGTRTRNGEIRFTCIFPEKHTNGDAAPSARWNADKGTWFCDVCRAGGGYVDLARRLGVDLRGGAGGARENGSTPGGRGPVLLPPDDSNTRT